jgi:16S rRNA (guanine527-N7)-methyltransferase
MPILTLEAISDLLQPYLGPRAQSDLPDLFAQLHIYLELILKWNAKTNLTAIRTPEEIVRRHFGESLFAGTHLGPCDTLLDFGSGAGFPGLPIQMLRPEVAVTLSESRNKKAAFLREAVRTLGLPTEVWSNRVEEMPPACQFHSVTLRAVDNMEGAVMEAATRATHQLFILTTSTATHAPEDFHLAKSLPMPRSKNGTLLIFHRG